MIVNSQRRRARLMILLLSVALIILGSGGYLYFTKGKEPTNGIFVYDHAIREVALGGDLY